MSELEARLKEMREDVEAWRQAAAEMNKVAQIVGELKSVQTAFGYLGKRGEADTTYATLNDTLRSLAQQADATFKDVEGKLNTVIRVYEGTEERNKELVSRVKKGWNF
ncbi:hypothetical protein Ssi03_53660 [Sphaerisporangium siamense]|uniref:Conjugal transfer/entry exclusion protein n=1 Tax=Sphaerisporangium siamense TaxID=795645 RepID=A0A7W7D949_9ACTN|nr:hypothetical protein [Sphaerisporangium siamense]MBB4701256.1 conjugal transfer/entry exclusion protein [Sphaerisporangium siamense]GII87376.1 hypothetical protein Ssi03_53660 [Sphaerisporangium siamense]